MTGHNISCDAADSRIRYLSGTWTGTDSQSTADQATVSFDFEGTFIAVLGSVAFPDAVTNGSSLIYTLDGAPQASTAVAGTVYSSQLLPSRQHTLQISSTTNGTKLTINGMIFTTGDSRIPTAGIVIAVVGPIVLVLVILLGLLLYKRTRSRQMSFSDGPLHVSLPLSKEAFTSRNYSNYGISFYSTPSTDNLTRPPPRAKTRARPWNGK